MTVRERFKLLLNGRYRDGLVLQVYKAAGCLLLGFPALPTFLIRMAYSQRAKSAHNVSPKQNPHHSGPELFSNFGSLFLIVTNFLLATNVPS